MHYTPRVTFQEPIQKVRGSLPDLRPDCACGCSRNSSQNASRLFRYGDSCGSTESMIDESDNFFHRSIDEVLSHEKFSKPTTSSSVRHCSENDLIRGRDIIILILCWI